MKANRLDREKRGLPNSALSRPRFRSEEPRRELQKFIMIYNYIGADALARRLMQTLGSSFGVLAQITRLCDNNGVKESKMSALRRLPIRNNKHPRSVALINNYLNRPGESAIVSAHNMSGSSIIH